MNSWVVIQAIINGLLSGGVYSLVAVGITIIFGVMKIVNFAAGAYLLWGMYFTWLWAADREISPYILIPAVIISMIIFGYLTFKSTIRQVIGKGGTSLILITVGLSFFLQNLAQTVFGTNPLTVKSDIKLKSLHIGGFTIGYPRLIAFGAMLILVIAVHLLLNKTLIGRAMRATAEKPEVAELLGVNTQKVYTFAFVLGVTLAAISGLLMTPLYYVSAMVGDTFRIAPLLVVVLGGMGSIKGALVGGILMGIIEQLVSTLVSADLGPAGMCILFLIVLYLMPHGLFGKGVRAA